MDKFSEEYDFVTIIGVIGSIASIGGALFSWYAERKAKKHANAAESAKNQIVNKQKTSELVSILYDTKKVQKVFVKYATAQTQSSLNGVNFEKDAEELRDFISRINESRSIIKETSDLDSDKIYTELQQLFTDYCQDKTLKNKREVGKQIILKIDEVIHKIRKSIDIRNEEIIK